MKLHHYRTEMQWTGNLGSGTKTYASYTRNFDLSCEGKPVIAGSSDKAFRGDPSRYNPEEMLVAALSSCHMLSYLHMCAVNGVVVEEYTDTAEGTMQDERGSCAFSSVELHPRVIIDAHSDPEKALALHENAHHECFIAKSVNFPVTVVPEIVRRQA
jgi:organic hydroperoxide reductase OsmC/OhrA